MQNLSIILQKRPSHTYPKVNDIFQSNHSEFPITQQLKEGEVLLRTLYLSIDAAMRVWMGPKPSYFRQVNPGDIMIAFGAAEVLASNSKKFKVGDHVTGILQWQKFCIFNDKDLKKYESSLPIYHELGALGVSGLSAWVGLEDIGKTKQTDIAVVSAAAGAVGQIAIQLLKYHYKCRLVIGIAGGQEKCQLVVSLGADYCIDYQTENISTKLSQIAPKGIDVYFDNVGGEQLDAVLLNINDNSRIVLCGAVSQYNTQKNSLKNISRLIAKRSLMQGFIYWNHADSFPKGRKILEDLLSKGLMKANYEIHQGLDQAPFALQQLQLGKNKAKVVVKVWKDEEWEKQTIKAKL